MSYQVGASCYATVVDAGGAACAAYAPISSIVADGAVVRTVTCTSADPSTGSLNLQISSTPIDGSASSIAYVSQAIAFPSCTQSDYVAATEIVVAAVLACWAAVYALNAIRKYLDWSRGEPS
jgi:hypothetical protein